MSKFFKIFMASALLAFSSAATAEWSGNVALTSDYAFRGISQTLEEPAIQGGIDWAGDLFYVGFWGSNVDFGEDSAVVDQGAQLELDLYAGLSGNFTDAIGWDLGVIYYAYPGADSDLNYDFIEFVPAVSAQLGPVATSFSVAYSPDYFAESGDGYYYLLGAELPLAYDFGLGLSVGHQTIDDNDTFGTPDYTDWSVSLSKSFPEIVDISIAYIDTDLDDNECFGGSDLCGSRGVVTVSREF